MKKFLTNNRLFVFAVGLAISLRFYFEALIWLGIKFVPFKGSPYWDILELVQRPKWLLLWGNFDGAHYINIAENGYNFGLSQAFFPFYPQLMRWLNLSLIHNSIWSGLLISGFSLIIFLYFFIKLSRLDYSLETTRWSILFLLLFPTSFFFYAIYTESLFLMLMVLVFYFSRKKQFLLAALLAGFASATRLVGIFLLPAIIWEYYRVNRKPKFMELAKISLLSASGLLLYLNYLQNRFHNFLIFVTSQPAFGSGRQVDSLTLIYQVFYRYLKMFFRVSPANDIYLVLVFEFMLSLIVLGGLFYALYKKFRLSYLIFMIPAYLLPTLTGNFSSMPRYILTCFPLVFLLAGIKNKPVKIVILAILVLIQAWAFIRFSRGYWIS